MRKVIKISVKVCRWAFLLFVVLPIALSALLSVPGVQNFAVHTVTRKLSRALQTRVEVDRVDIGLFGQMKLRGLYVEDYQKDTLLYAGRAEAYVTALGIFSHQGIVLDRAQLSDAKLYLRETPSGVMNIKQIVDSISDPDKPKSGKFKLRIRCAVIDGMAFRLERLVHRNPVSGIDFGDMYLRNLSARMDNFVLSDRIIRASIRTVSACEESGFTLNRLSGTFYFTQGRIGFKRALILTPRSMVEIPSILLTGASWDTYKDFIRNVRIEAQISNSTLASDDIACFAPSLAKWHTVFKNLNLDAMGTVADFEGKIKDLQVGDATHLTTDFTVRGLPNIKNTQFDLNIPTLQSSADDIRQLASNIGDAALSDQIVGMLDKTGAIDLDARFRGMFSDFDMQLGVKTDAGRLTTRLTLKPFSEGERLVRGDVQAHDMKLGQLLGREDLLGKATVNARINGVVGQGRTDARVTGAVTHLDFNDYIYDSIRFDGRLLNKEFNGRITARDPNLNLDFTGLLDLVDSLPRYDFTMNLRHADLAALHINRRDSVSQLSAHATVRASGRTLDDLNGRIRISDAHYAYNDKQIETKELIVEGQNSATSKYVELRSDFADALFRSRSSYMDIFAYLRQSAARYLPVLEPQKYQPKTQVSTLAAPNDFSLLSVDIHHIDPIMDAITAGLQIADNSTLQLLFNPSSDRLSLKATSDYVERNRMLATRLDVTASNRGDSLTLYGTAEDLYLGALHLPQLSLTGGAKARQMQLSVGFNDTLRRTSALLGVRATVADTLGANGRVIDLRILPSHLTRDRTSWQIFANKIQIDTARIFIDRFYVMNRDQSLFMTGIASRSRSDSVTLQLHDFDLSPLSHFVESMGYEIAGRTTGSAAMNAVRGVGRLTADIAIDSLAVNGIEAPPLRLTSRWSVARNRAGLTVTDRIDRDTLVRGFYDPAQVRYRAQLHLDSLDLKLLDPLMTHVISSTHGSAAVDMLLEGEHRKANLTGQIAVSDLATTVDFTQVTYKIPRAVMTIRNNRFQSSNVPVYDTEGHRGRFDIDLNLQHLSNIAYDVRVAPQQMLVLNTTARDNDLFYGRMYASGAARITGDKGNVKMNIDATTDDNSNFFMPLSGKTDVSYADFVTFLQPDETDSLDALTLRKRQFERRQRTHTTAESQMNIEMNLGVRSGTEVELSIAGNVLQGRGNGDLNLQINPRTKVFTMNGDYTISEGSFLFSLENVINKHFVISPGSHIQWNGSPTDALLNVDAVYNLKASLQPLLQLQQDKGGGAATVPVDCVIQLRDKLSSPTVTFDVRVPNADADIQSLLAGALATPETVDTQFAYLLLFNSFMSENAASSMGSTISAASGVELIANMVNNLLSGDNYNVILRYRPKSDITGDEVDFGLSKSLINDRLLVEFEGNYMSDNPTNNGNISNFTGEAHVTYLIDRAGTLRLQAFTQTINSYDENQGLQETGLGVSYQEEFDNLKDLKRRVKEHFTSKKKAAQKAAGQAVRDEEPDDEEIPLPMDTGDVPEQESPEYD